MFHDGATYPVDLRVASHRLVAGVDHDDLEVFVCTVLGDPIAVKHT